MHNDYICCVCCVLILNSVYQAVSSCCTAAVSISSLNYITHIEYYIILGYKVSQITGS